MMRSRELDLVVFALIGLGLSACEQTGNDEQPAAKKEVKFTCSELPSLFGSYQDAIAQVSRATFPVHNVSATVNSSWIRGYSFHSCDGQHGYLIIRTDKGQYIHQNVPTAVFQEFRSASSLGRYYHQRIKGQYGM